MMRRVVHGVRGLSPAMLGLVVTALVVTGSVISYQKDKLVTRLSPGAEIVAEFSHKPPLEEGKSTVKIADVIVGKVADVETEDDVTSVTLKLDEKHLDVLGTKPKVHVRATSLLGGRHFVDLVPSGDGKVFDADAPIPAGRTTLPVELDEVLSAFPESARDGLQTTSKKLDQTLEKGGQQALRDLLEDVPEVSRPATEVLEGVQGTRPERDLQMVISFAQAAAAEITAVDGRVGAIVDDLSTTSDVLGANRDHLARTFDQLDETLVTTRKGSRAARTSLAKVEQTAQTARPAVRELSPLLNQADTALDAAAPVVRDLRPLLAKARPLVDDLVPTSRDASNALGNLDGKVLDRVSGPIKKTVLSDWHGTGKYEGNGNDNRLYEEVGFLAARGANLSQYGDKNGPLLALALGVGASSVNGVDVSLYQYLTWIGTVPGIGMPSAGQDGPSAGDGPEQTGPSGDGEAPGGQSPGAGPEEKPAPNLLDLLRGGGN